MTAERTCSNDYWNHENIRTKAIVAKDEDSRQQFKQNILDIDAFAAELVEKTRLGNAIIRNPILVSYAAKGMMPYRGLGSGIKSAIEAWTEIDFTDEREGCLFIATVNRKKPEGSEET